MNPVKPTLCVLALLSVIGRGDLACAQPGATTPAGQSVASTSGSAAEAAAWIPHDVMVAYQQLPRAYTCDALWHKVGDLLRAVGAWRAVSITPYDCKPSTSSDGLSPQLQVHFLTLRALAPQNARWSQAMARPATVVLEPGHPASLGPEDCELLRQTEQNLLSLVASWHFADQDLKCSSREKASYRLSVQTLVASSAK